MQKPNIVIATGYEALFAYMLMPCGDPQLIKRIEFSCDGPTDCPLVRWENKRLCYTKLAGMVDRILTRYKCDKWGLACRSEQMAPLLAELVDGPYYPTLAAIMETDHESVDLTNVRRKFVAAAGHPTGVTRFRSGQVKSIA